MAFVIVVIAVGVIALFTGGKLSNLKNIRFRYTWLVLTAIVLEIVTNSNLRHTLGISDPLASKLYMLSLALVALFVILNIELRGLALIGLGLLSNLAVIFFNGGYIVTGPQTKLYYLSDIFHMPHWVFITKVFSIGDVLITIGGCIFVWFFLKKPAPKKKEGIMNSIGYHSNNP